MGIMHYASVNNPTHPRTYCGKDSKSYATSSTDVKEDVKCQRCKEIIGIKGSGHDPRRVLKTGKTGPKPKRKKI